MKHKLITNPTRAMDHEKWYIELTIECEKLEDLTKEIKSQIQAIQKLKSKYKLAK